MIFHRMLGIVLPAVGIVLFAFSGAGAAPRVVTLAPSLTEMVLDLGCGAMLAGVADDPEDGTAKSSLKENAGIPASVPRIGPYHRPSMERIASSSPDICLGIADGTPTPLLRRLRELGIRAETVRIDSLADLAAAYRMAGGLIGAEEAAEGVALRIAERTAAADAAVKACEEEGRPRPRMLFVVQRAPLMAAGSGTFAGSLLERAGYGNAVSAQGYPIVSRERLFRMPPDIVIDATPEGGVEVMLPKGVETVRADASMFSRPSLRALDALDALVRLRYHGANAAGTSLRGR